MKNLPLLLLFMCAVAASCKKSSSSGPTGSPLINGLTGIKYKARYDSAWSPRPVKYYSWAFSGTNPISAVTISDSLYAGSEHMYFTGQNATRLEYYASIPYDAINGSTVTISYNSANLPDTLTVTYPVTAFGHKQFAFEYTGSQLTKVTEARPKSSINDTLDWDNPYCFYHYSYNGADIAGMITQYSGSTPDTLRFTTGTIKNNLASFPVYFLIEFIASTNGSSYFPYNLHYYLGAHAIESIITPSGTSSIKYITDPAGRISWRINQGFPISDTLFYYY